MSEIRLVALDVDSSTLTYAVVANGTRGTATITNTPTKTLTMTPKKTKTAQKLPPFLQKHWLN